MTTKIKFSFVILIMSLFICCIFTCTLNPNKPKKRSDSNDNYKGNYDLKTIQGITKAISDKEYLESKIQDFNIAGSSDTFKYGDVNKDGAVDIIDAMLTAQYCSGLNPAAFIQKSAADVDDNGVINILDALLIAKYQSGLINSFAAESNLMKNGHLHDEVVTNWDFFQQYNGQGAMEVVNGELKTTVINGGDYIWSLGLLQAYFNLEKSAVYNFKFRARTTSANPTYIRVVFQMQQDPWTSYVDRTFEITQEMKEYSFNFIMNTSDPQAGFNFHLGTPNQNGADIYIDDVCLYKTDKKPLDPYVQARNLGKGVNFGNLMDAYPQEGSWSNGIKIQESHFDLAKSAGFDSVRIPIRFSNYASFDGPDYKIDETFMKRVDQVVEWGLSKGLKIIIDMHHYRNDDFVTDDPHHNDINKYPEENKARFIAMWKQIAARYKDYSGSLYYELLNEPNDKLTVDVWNGILADCIHAIRQIDNYHTIIVGCVDWSNIDGLNGLIIPADETNTIVTFHYYNPFLFVDQGQEWAGPDAATTGIAWPGPPSTPLTPAPGVSQWVIDWINWYNTEQDPNLNPCGPGVIQTEIKQASDWGISNNRPLWMGEFCTQDGGDIASRARWTEFVRKELEKYNISWSYWTLLSDPHAYLYDINTDKWITELTNALGLSVSN